MRYEITKTLIPTEHSAARVHASLRAKALRFARALHVVDLLVEALAVDIGVLLVVVIDGDLHLEGALAVARELKRALHLWHVELADVRVFEGLARRDALVVVERKEPLQQVERPSTSSNGLNAQE